jgi:hypothetical protein
VKPGLRRAVILRILAWTALMGGVASLVACTRKIGDECRSSIDCSQESDRLCDISQPSGYCTIEGCDERTCPSGSACVRFFPNDLSKTCAADTDCTPAELCLLPEKLCAPRASERRFCVDSCSGNSDCRSGYECRLAGDKGTLPLHPNPASIVHFCAPVAK